jgi:DNA-binding MarR family transcriptional regulator
MISVRTRTPEGDAATDVVLATFRANGLLLAAGHRLAAREGLTAARWQVLGAVALAGRPLTVPQIARRMGLTRQAVQATVNRLRRDALVGTGENLDHRRSPLIRLTELGRQKYAALDQRQIRWINELSAGLKISDLTTTARLLRELSDSLETTAPPAERRNGDDDTT